jgi:hypothetical protein
MVGAGDSTEASQRPVEILHRDVGTSTTVARTEPDCYRQGWKYRRNHQAGEDHCGHGRAQ